MFEYGEGMFHLVFANWKDDYYTDTLLKMKFIPYLRYCLIKEEFRYIYIFGKSSSGTSNGYAVQFVGSRSRAALEVKKGWGAGLFSHANKKKAEQDYNIQQEELEETELFKTLDDVLRAARKAERAAVVVPLALFHKYADEKPAQELLEEMKRSKCKCAVILTTSVIAVENDAFFINDELRFSVKETQRIPASGIFWNERIFPEVQEAFCKGEKNTSKAVFQYNELKRSFGARMHVWNELSYQSVFNAVQHFLLRLDCGVKTGSAPEYAGYVCRQCEERNCAEIGSAPEYAAVIWAWYSSAVFRDRNPIAFTNNPYRQIKLIIDDLAKPEIRSRIKEIARQENAARTDEFIKRYEQFENIAYIRNISATNDLLQIFQRFCEVSRGRMTQEDEKLRIQLLKRTALFSLPSYVSAHCRGEPPHLLISGYKDRIDALLDKLRADESWNCLLSASARILTEMLIMISDVMKEKCSGDAGNDLSGMKLELAIESAEYCAKMSAKSAAQDEALDFCEEIIPILHLSNASKAEYEMNYPLIKDKLNLARKRNSQT